MIISSCQVVTTYEPPGPCPPVEEDYSDGIYFFVASCNNEGLRELKFDYIYEEDSSEIINTYCIKLDKTKVSDVIKVDIDKLKLIRFYFLSKRFGEGICGIGNYDKISFKNLENGLYVIEFYGHSYNINTSYDTSYTVLKKTRTINYYLNNKTYYDDCNMIFIKNNYETKSGYSIIRYMEVNNSSLISHIIPFNEIRGFIFYDTLITECVRNDGQRQPIDYSTIKHGDSSIDITQLGNGYYYTELTSDGNFTTPVKLNSYKDIINN